VDGLAQVQSRIAEIRGFFPQQVAVSSNTTSTSTTTGADSFAAAFEAAQAPKGGSGGSGAQSADESQAVSLARKYLGIPYVWGGTNPDVGLDCSGLTQLIYKEMGIDIPRVSSDQARGGRAVDSLADARPGDLVFYDYSSSRDGIDHVGIYIGDGKIINAPKPGDVVKIADVGSPVAIRRYLPENSGASSATPGVSATASARVSALGSGGSQVPYADLFNEAGTKYGVPSALLAAVAKTESAFNPTARSSAGASGLMQFMPGTAADMGINPLVPSQAIDGAARYLSAHLREFGTVEKALAAYNAGPGTVRKYNGVPPYEETQNYVVKVKAAWEDYR
jgi:peptidoglycan DL-endopeptidase CwlO